MISEPVCADLRQHPGPRRAMIWQMLPLTVSPRRPPRSPAVQPARDAACPDVTPFDRSSPSSPTAQNG